jgi:DNA helicase II / ATP-dependent DNA helicase PcrA
VGMTRAMDTLILTRAQYRRRYGNDSPESSVPSRFLEEVPQKLMEDLGGGSPGWSTAAYRAGSRNGDRSGYHSGEADGRHYNYEDESQDTPRVASGAKAAPRPRSAASPDSIDNIQRFFGTKAAPGKPGGGFARPAMDLPQSSGASGLKKGQRVRHSKYGEGTVLFSEGEGDEVKLTVMFNRHGMKKLMEKFANLQKI